MHNNSSYFFTHLRELHLRTVYVILSWCICFIYSYCNPIQVIYFIVKPLSLWSLEDKLLSAPQGEKTMQGQPHLDFIYTDISEAFYATLYACLIVSGLIITPLIIYHGWCFLMPSRYQGERALWNKRLTSLFIYISTMMWLILGYLLPNIYIFLHLFAVKTGLLRITLEARIAPYLSWIFTTIFLFLLLTLLPIVTWIALKNKIVSSEQIFKNRRLTLYILLILAALVSPPDMGGQLILTLFLYTFKECVVWYYLYRQAG